MSHTDALTKTLTNSCKEKNELFLLPREEEREKKKESKRERERERKKEKERETRERRHSGEDILKTLNHTFKWIKV